MLQEEEQVLLSRWELQRWEEEESSCLGGRGRGRGGQVDSSNRDHPHSSSQLQHINGVLNCSWELQAGSNAAAVLDEKQRSGKEEDKDVNPHHKGLKAAVEDTTIASDPLSDECKFSGELEKVWKKLRGEERQSKDSKDVKKKKREIFRPEERWQGDTARREELARRVILENHDDNDGSSGYMPSPLSHLVSNKPQGSFSTSHNKPAAIEDDNENATGGEESVFQSDDGELSPMEREMVHALLDSSPPIQQKLNKESCVRKPQNGSGRKPESTMSHKQAINVRLKGRSSSTRDRKLTRSVVAPAPALDDELELSDMPQHGCGGGLNWDWSRIHRYNNNNNNSISKTFVDLAALMCTFPDTVERKEAAVADDAAKEVSENGWSFSHVHYHHQEAAAEESEARAADAAAAGVIAHGQRLSSFNSEPDALPPLLEDDVDGDGEETHEILGNGGMSLPPLHTTKPTQELHQLKNHLPFVSTAAAAARKQRHKGSSLKTALKDLPAVEVPPPLQPQQSSKTSAAAAAVADEQETHRTLSQKYRPRSFKEVEGQTMVVKSLSSSIMKGKVAPVYLFMGPRGTGKTTMARIFAAALNCLSLQTEQRPCQMCQACEDISLNRSSSPDVKEVDASSNVDIQGMRAMVGGFSPSHLRYKVIIVEGCDFLSTQVWNAFLKVLEEPPKNLVFILITTDAERLPLTVTSRCQKFPFCRVKEDDIVRRLKMMAVKEGLEVEEEALVLIASTADGSLRDAEMTMDQLSLLDRRISLVTVQELVGLVPDGKLLDLLDLALSAEAGNTVRFMRDLLKSGLEPLSLLSQLASLITNILAGTFDVHPETRHHKGFFRRNFSKKEEQQRLREALKVLSKAEKQLRIASDQPTWLTAALLQFAPDRSFLPSSVNTSIAHSPAAFDLNHQQRTTATTTTTKNRVEEENQPESSSHLLRMMDPQNLEKTWTQVLQVCQSKVLKQLLQSHAHLIAIGIQDEERYVVVQVEFHHPEFLTRAERSERSIRHAFQMVLSCPVQLRISLDGVHNTTVGNLSGDLQAAAALASSSKRMDERQLMGGTFEENFFQPGGIALDIHGVAPLGHHHHRHSRARKHRRAGGIKEHEIESMVSRAGSHRSHRNRRQSSASSVMKGGEIGQSWDPSWPQASRRYASSSTSHAGFSDSLAVGLSEAQSKGQRALLKTMMEEPQGELETLDENWSLGQSRKNKHDAHVKPRKDSSKLASGTERKSRRMESQLKPTRGVLCWKALHSDKLKMNLRRRRSQGKAVFFRFVPCGKLNRTPLTNGSG
ncbi:unnamed protein product [Sphagnum troendelagicum]|uniref:AAA+ ATPase domain-containing protein n=1 Tax=Sphagnum troendelagicum TaxID=128251 RepID=A0ABP0TE78_9BRYO